MLVHFSNEPQASQKPEKLEFLQRMPPIAGHNNDAKTQMFRK